MKLSIVIPAYNEADNINQTLTKLLSVLETEIDSFEIIVVNDNSLDQTAEQVQEFSERFPQIILLNRQPPGGFGRAIRAGLDAVTGDVIIPFMADASDDPEDIIKYYRKIEEGYDCVFGSRFIKGSSTLNYPSFKLLVNRIVNKCLQVIFFTHHNDLTNAFKAYRREVISSCGPYLSSHFNITLELSLSALIRGYSIAKIPISWQGRTAGLSNLRLNEMGRRYLSVIIRMFCEKVLIGDDLIAEKVNLTDKPSKK